MTATDTAVAVLRDRARQLIAAAADRDDLVGEEEYINARILSEAADILAGEQT